MRRVPDDVLRLIFIEVVKHVHDYFRLDTQMGAWSLSKVCSRWRDVALSTPLLWSMIAIVRRGERFPTRLDAILSASLTRSGEIPLDIIFSGDDDSALGIQALQMIVLHVSRWESLCVDVTPEVYQCLGAIQCTPSLKRVDLRYSWSGQKFDFLHHAPKLQYLRTLTYGGVTQYLQVPWNQLISLHFEHQVGLDGAYFKFNDILPRFSHLRHLVIESNARLANSKVTLPNLETLSLTWNSVMLGLQYLILPVLSKLMLDAPFPAPITLSTNGNFKMANAIVDIVTVLENSLCPLTEFTLKLRGRPNNYILDIHVVCRLLRVVPSLEIFDFFVNMDVYEKMALFSRLTCRQDEEILAPQLQSLVVGGCHREEEESDNPFRMGSDADSDASESPESEEMLRKMIDSRRAHGQVDFSAAYHDDEQLYGFYD